MYKTKTNIPLVPETEGYYIWLNSLQPGDEVAYKKEGSYWHSNLNSIQIVIENDQKNKILILANGSKINLTTGREQYTKSSYHDRGVHILQVTDDLRYDIELELTKNEFRKALDFKFSISEMKYLISVINKMLVKRKSHVPTIKTDV